MAFGGQVQLPGGLQRLSHPGLVTERPRGAPAEAKSHLAKICVLAAAVSPRVSSTRPPQRRAGAKAAVTDPEGAGDADEGFSLTVRAEEPWGGGRPMRLQAGGHPPQGCPGRCSGSLTCRPPLPQVRSPTPALTAAGPSPTAPTCGPTCRRTRTPRNTSASAAPRPSPAWRSWRGTRSPAAAPPERRRGRGAGRPGRASPFPAHVRDFSPGMTLFRLRASSMPFPVSSGSGSVAPSDSRSGGGRQHARSPREADGGAALDALHSGPAV